MATYLFITYTNYESGKLTGAHKRFLELVKGIARENDILLISPNIPQLKDIPHIQTIRTSPCMLHLPAHVKGILELTRCLQRVKHTIHYDYAIAFHAVHALCYELCGYHNITSIFREDLVGYQMAVGTSKVKVSYFKWMEHIAVCASDKIIVQCRNDKDNLLKRHEKTCSNLKDKIYIQINNANASWMNTGVVEHQESADHKVNILFIGGFSDERKGHKQLLAAVAKLLDENYLINLYIAGDGKQLDYYKNLYKDYSSMKFLGRVNVRNYLESCDFEVVPSLIDSCPNTVLEGINAGIAVYGANRGGIPDLLQERTYLFEPDVEHISNFLRCVINNKRYTNDAKKQKALKNELSFDWAKEMEKIIEG